MNGRKIIGATNNMTGNTYAVRSVGEDGSITLEMDKHRTMTLPMDRFLSQWVPIYEN
jgi:hypothetical protein